MKVSLSLGELCDLRKKFQESYKCEECLTQKEYYKFKGCGNQIARIMTRHCVEYDDLVHAPYCKMCKPYLPKILATNRMIKHCQYNSEDFYNLDKSTASFRLLKEHLPEADAEVDSFFYSIIPKDRLPIDPLTLNALAKFCKVVFENNKYVRFSRWCVESGKWENKPNPHIHAVVKFQDSANFARFMSNQWKKVMPLEEHTISFSRYNKKLKRNVKGIDIYRCMNAEITGDKIKYLDNSLKGEFGEDHTNYIDLGINGAYEH